MKKTGSSFKFLAVVLFAFFATVKVFAETSVSAEVDRNQLGIGDALTLDVRVESDEDFETPPPVLPKVAGLEEINSLVGGRQSSSSMSIINGKTQFKSQTSQDFQYLLSPQKEGTFIIPVIDVTVNGKTYKTQPIKIEVREEFRNGSKKAQPKKNGRRFPPGFGDDDENGNVGADPNAEDLFDQLLQQQQRIFNNGGVGGGINVFPGGGQSNQVQSKTLNGVNTQDAFFVYLELDKNEAYEGEQVTANWYIYTKANIESLDRVKFPDLKGFWKEIIEEVPSLQFTEEIVNGVRYRKALLASHALFPIKAGSAVVDEFRIKAKIRNLTQFGWGKPYDVTKASKRTELKVLPLPQEGRTTSFSGAVGSYRVSVKTEGKSFPANQPFSVKIRYEGLGNAKLIDLPNIKWPEGLEIYDTKNEAKFFKEGNSYKEFEVLVIPRKTGEIRIPSFDLTYFDPAQKKYITQSTEEIVLQITPGDSLAQNNASQNQKPAAPNEAPVAANPQPILILPEAGLSLSQFRLEIYLAIFLSGIVVITLLTLRQLAGLKKESEFFILVNEKLRNLEKFSTSNDFRKVGSEATNLIYLLVANLAGQKKADQELHLLIKEISMRDQQKYLDRINMLFDYFQLLGFSPDEIMQNAMTKKPLKEQFAQLKNLTKEIVDNLKKEDKNNP
ncbi:MAG: BatD family protein [Pseudobdellovibrio sp.]